MVPIISIVGEKGSGKTTLIEGIIPELKKRGYRVATVKHCCEKIEVDREGKDSFRHLQAGARGVALSSPNKVVIQKKLDAGLSLDEVAGLYFEGVDVVLVEGYRSKDRPSIEILTQEEPLSSANEPLAVVSARSGGPKKIKELADLIEKKFLKPKSETSVQLIVNGQEVSLNKFVTGFIKNTLLGMISSLRGAEKADKVIVKVSNNVS